MKNLLVLLTVLSQTACFTDWDTLYDTCRDEGRCGDAGHSPGDGGGGGSGGGGSGGDGGASGGGSGGGEPPDSGVPDAGSPVVLVFTPSNWDAGVLGVGSTSVLEFDLDNNGTSPTGRLTFSIDVDAGFKVITPASNPACGSNPLLANFGCKLKVEFAPTEERDVTAHLTVTEATYGSSASVTLLGSSVFEPVKLFVRVAGDAGPGLGTVLVSDDAGSTLGCSGDCDLTYRKGTTVVAEFLPAQSTFLNWSGACSGSSCSLTLTDDAGTTITAHVQPWPLLNVVIQPPGMARGDARVTGPNGLDCPGQCSARVQPAGSVTVNAIGSPFASLSSSPWTGCSAGNNPCSISNFSAAGQTATVTFRAANRMFVSPTPLALDLGAAAADRACTDWAIDAGLSPSNWRAWLAVSGSDAGTDAPMDVVGATRGWVRVDGLPFLDDKAATSGKTFYPPVVDQRGVDRSPTDGGLFLVAVGSPGQNCSNWSSQGGQVRVGLATAGATLWTGERSLSCSTPLHVYCFQASFDGGVASTPMPAGGRIAFLSSVKLSGAAAAESTCTNDGLAFPGRSFVPLRTTGTASAASRVATDAGTWYRPDGVRLLDDAADLRSTTRFKASIHQFANGTYLSTPDYAWTGATSPSAASTDNCADWTMTTAPGGYGGLALDSAASSFNGGSFPCTQSLYVYCFQQ